MRTATGLTFTQLRVQSVRSQYEIPRGRGQLSGEACFTVEQAAHELGVSGQTVHAWLRSGLLRGEQLTVGAPWRIVLDESTRRHLAGEEAPAGWVGLEQAAGRLRVSKQTVSTWVKSGKLQAVRIAKGRRKGWRICVDSVGYEKQLGLDLTKPSTERR